MSITNRLKLLKRETDPDKREQLVGQTASLVNYIYYEGKTLSRKINRARNTLEHLQ